MKTVPKLSVAALVALVVVGGCGGGVATILAALGIVKLHDIYTDITDQISPNPEDTLVLLLDGYVARTDVPNRQGELALGGLPEGRFLLSLISPDYRRGWHELVEVGAADRIQINPFTGAVISGSVSREATGGGAVRVANALVVAFRDGATRLADGLGPLTVGSADVDYVMALTDAAGEFTLGPVAYGRWLVVAIVAGYAADARVVDVAAGADARGVALVVAAAEGEPTATVQGTVARASTGRPLEGALVRADLSAPYVPAVSAAARTRVENAVGRAMPDDRWVAVGFLAAVTGAAGDYILRVPAGDMRLWAYKYPYRGAYTDVSTQVGGVVSQDFRLKDA